MTVVQAASLYARPTNTATTPFDQQSSFTSSRTLADYYTPTKACKVTGGSTTTLTGDTFTYSTSGTAETFTNTVKTGTLTIENEIVNGDTGEETTYTVQFNTVFGKTNNDMTSGYNQVKAYKGAIDSTASAGATGMISNGTNVGTFTLKNNQKLVISGIPYGTEYIVTETVNTNATAAVSLDGGTATEYTSGDDKSGAINNSNGADVLHFKNERTREVSVKKTDKDNPSTNTGLGNALFDLFFKESITPTRYTVNDPTVAPNKKSSVHVDSSITAPAADTTETTIVNTNKTVAYSGDTPPSASDSEWIFPRNDTDYIYFRDFNSGSQGEHDTTAFGSSSKLAWRTVWFASMGSGTHNQYEELGFDESKWMAAEFSGPGKQTVRYAVWERFVDDSVGNRNTVVYKIQPPDGYTSVKFMLMEGDTPSEKHSR